VKDQADVQGSVPDINPILDDTLKKGNTLYTLNTHVARGMPI
jgi:hypothetical protein